MSTTVSQPRQTEKFSKSFGGSLKSLMGGQGRTYFILEHKTKTQKYRAGQTTEFIGDYIELGRGNNFAVSFGDDCNTVSRPHAAIVRKGEGWLIKSLSKVNPTLLNGQSIRNESALRNGDEIQLSYEGPKVAFLTPPDNKVSSMGMTVRLKAMANEAIKPYKTAVASLLVLLLASGYGLFYFFQETKDLKKDNKKLLAQAADAKAINKEEKEQLEKENQIKGTTIKGLQEKVYALNKIIVNHKSPVLPTPPTPPNVPISQLYPGVYYILSNKLIVQIGDETKEVEFGGSGTGFLLKDGRFVTARHVIEPWCYTQNAPEESRATLLRLNLVANNGGKVIHYIEALSPSGDKLTFTSADFNVDRSNDISKKITTDDGNSLVITTASLRDGTDWAVSQTSHTGILAHDSQLSTSLRTSTELHVLGYPFSAGVNNRNDIEPIYSKCNVARNGLDKGIIDVSSVGYDPGNSGGPVFFQINNNYVVVGIVSGSRSNQGVIVPISSIR